MKTKFTLLATILMIATFPIFSAVYTVSNHPSGGSQYSSLLAAYNAASAGDTLLLEGTGLTYDITSGCCNSWNKSLTVIGIGFYPDKQNPLYTIIRRSTNNIEFQLGSSAAGSKFYGIVFTGQIYFIGSCSNILFEDCYFGSSYEFSFGGQAVSNVIFRNCIFSRGNNICINIPSSGNLVTNILITNCVFNGFISGGNNLYNTLVINNCLFLSTASGHFSSLHLPIIQNSIFMNFFPDGVTNGTWNNNLCRVAGTLPPTGGGGNSGTGNIDNTDPNFVNYTLNTLYNDLYDFNLQPGSAAIGSGTGGTDIGVHGGDSGFSRFGEVLHNPIIRSMSIQNTLVAPNGSLSVDIHASKPHED